MRTKLSVNLPPPALLCRHVQRRQSEPHSKDAAGSSLDTKPLCADMPLGQEGSGLEAASGGSYFMALPQLQDPINPDLFIAAPKSQHIFSYNPEPRRQAGNDSSSLSDMKADLHY